MGETPAIKQRVHFAGSNLAFKQYAKVCFLGTILLLGFFSLSAVTMQNTGYIHYSSDLMAAEWKETLQWVFVNVTIRGVNVLDCMAVIAQRWFLVLSAVSGRYLSSQLAFEVKTHLGWRTGPRHRMLCPPPLTPSPPWGYTIPSSH